jgi:hypothetical protein
MRVSYSYPHSVNEMLRTDTTHRHHDRFFAYAQGVLFVVMMMITILAAIPAEAQGAGSSASSRAHSTPGYAARRRTNATAEAEVQRLLRLMDKDKNGAVSKDEFMEYMSQTFDRLDVNRSGQIERNELSKAEFPFGRGTSAAAATDVRQLLRLMDKDVNGTVSKEEFMEYMSQTFDRLDVNRSDQLDRNELRRMADPNWLLCHDLRMC